jgi:fructokinase
MQPHLLVFGEALIDLKNTGPLEFQGFVGGSPLNVALAGSRLGTSSALATRVSTDFFGAQIANLLAQNDVHLEYLERGDEPTTLAFVQIQNGHPQYSFRFLDTSTLAYSPMRLNAPQGLRAVHYGGSLNPLFEPLSTRVLEVVHGLPGLKHFDPNVRPAVLGDAVAYNAKLEPWWGLADWIKLSKEDLEFLHPGIGESDFANAKLEQTAVVVITDGGHGARLYRRNQAPLEVRTPKITVVDTVGAGDTFSGSTISKLLELNLESKAALEQASDTALLEVLNFAATAAAINCTRAGCDPPTRAEIAAFGGG